MARDSGGHSQIVGKEGFLFQGNGDIIENLEKVAVKISKSSFSHKLPYTLEIGRMYLEFAEKVVQHRTNLASNSKKK